MKTRSDDARPRPVPLRRVEGAAPEVLEGIVRWAEEARASDIHLQVREEQAEVMFRLDGVMVPAMNLEHEVAERVLGRVKFLAKLKTYQESLPQDGRIRREDLGTERDVRVATYPTVTGEKVVLRLFTGSGACALEDLSLPPMALGQLKRLLGAQAGLILLTGPAGSGKTTTIYACLRHLVELGGRHIITVEDPVEEVLPGLMQTEVSEARGLSYAKAARHLLRQDPQILVIGEIRDQETASVVVRAALTGHLVISTLHAGSCAGVLQRLLTMVSDKYAVASALELVLNQRLMRRCCVGCGGEGCGECLETGYRGRVPVLEWFVPSEAQRRLMRDGELEGVGAADGLVAEARQLVEGGITDEAEFSRQFGS